MPVVSYLPYYPDRRVDTVIGQFHVWNWQHRRETMVADLGVRTYLDRYFGLFRLPNGDPETRIAIISQSGRPAIPAANEFIPREIARFTSALMACHLFMLPTDPNAGVMACTSDNFVAFYKEFDSANLDRPPSFTYGSYVKVNVLGSWEHLTFTTPQYVHDPRPCYCDTDLLTRISPLTSDPSENAERIFRSLEWLRLAFANYDGLEYQARIVAMTTAFEIQLDFPEREKGRYFADTVNRLIPRNNLPRTTQPVGPRNMLVTDNEVGWWCRNFYSLRSRIVHGEALQQVDFVHTRTRVEHLRIALSLFAECIRGRLIETGRMQEQERAGALLRFPWREQLGLPDNAWYP